MKDYRITTKNILLGDKMKSNINVWIAKSEMSKKEVAEKMGISQTVLSRWVNNKSMPSVENLFKLADILNCKVDDLYEKENNHENNL